MGVYEIIFGYGIGIPSRIATGDLKDIIRRTKTYLAFNYPDVKRFSIYHANSPKNVGHWVRRGTRWYEDY